MNFQVEKFTDIKKELPSLFQAHWEEAVADKDKIPLNPAWERYQNLEDTGVLHILTARQEGVLVGYFFAMVFPHLHYATSLTAFSDMFFIMKPYRRGAKAIKLIKETEKMLRALKVEKVYIAIKVEIDISWLLVGLGYRFIEKTFTKDLRGAHG